MRAFAENLLHLRYDKGLSDKELGAMCGKHDSDICKYENDRMTPNIYTAKRIADALGVTLDAMLRSNPHV